MRRLVRWSDGRVGMCRLFMSVSSLLLAFQARAHTALPFWQPGPHLAVANGPKAYAQDWSTKWWSMLSRLQEQVVRRVPLTRKVMTPPRNGRKPVAREDTPPTRRCAVHFAGGAALLPRSCSSAPSSRRSTHGFTPAAGWRGSR
ncbi:hypothetical protein CC85DRAFT_32031 [Cutaneotrichosporon oleaginosum]|uniref:Uncharacterized protein n=1 Tax=Cutaneotrichosporon oleaginosum TaxID=879819 RepID=A0A0J0XSV3_9TREE|nr:uncharacterized protein CC85DRAFT_32031 [Cutaneotrichosporon oleaginosum]KLT44135.1 hypothetical protein CC85DRAFT_32031 [Cutaneotrichosporon oleaginosum]TXT09410.1 hypothetical protein COLE_03344 [Cutaneotrichosporon oleaginosum]